MKIQKAEKLTVHLFTTSGTVRCELRGIDSDLWSQLLCLKLECVVCKDGASDPNTGMSVFSGLFFRLGRLKTDVHKSAVLCSHFVQFCPYIGSRDTFYSMLCVSCCIRYCTLR